ncbi:MotA/TolQ/ExbB proton channel family protein [Caulobacter mirabilis]|uniref:MotA/TolQ/ExbB proton channel domain-containing protein n=1 Tax=Caulobacter mirabilis TaxID=69666 RepID=A0A2D2ATU6_9CAUL|nr:MotA/TolQ/ExbB proton channel family protein [Caulobacter mirabilis]ATQ41421.1 hypothetical protein CSW64_02820 [Caulobacter mirabilis]
MSRSSIAIVAAAAALALPAVAQAAPLTPLAIFGDAAPPMKLLILALAAATVAAVVVCALKLASGPKLTGGSAFLSGLRLGGPLAGLLGASYTSLMIFIGLSNVAGPVPMKVIAPGVAEALFILGLGVLAGSVAVIANWAVEARIDRMVLKA